jgi:diguanylate cyclase (GGDEF)-like protein
VSLADPGPPEGLRTQFSLGPETGSRVVETNGFAPEEVRQLEAKPDGLLVEVNEGSPHYLALHRGSGIRQCLLLPLFVRQQLAGVVALGHEVAAVNDPKRLVYARQIADQTARALTNLVTIAENQALSYYDRLTGLPNRLLFRERLEQAVERASRQREALAVCLFGLDSFKRINDTLGHDVGDTLLRQVAERALRIIPASSLARIGGDEFAVLLTNPDRIDDPARIARRILDAIETPFGLPQQEAFLTASIGIAVYPEDGSDSDVLLRNADVAMYHAKERSGNSFRFYAPAMNATAARNLELENDLRRASASGEMRLYYQPIVDIDSLQPVSAEALMRWQHPRLGLILPSEFIPLAERTGLIVELGKWALMTACHQNTAWQDAGLSPISISVNLSSRQLIGEGLLRTVGEALQSTGMNPAHLVLELTESMLMAGDETTLSTLRGLKALGIKLSIDDFGTGYSSLSYLKNFPLDHLKVDRSFLRDVTRSDNDAAITRAIVAMAHSLELRVVGEGVETEEQLAFLRELRCETIQGYLISEPLAADGFTKFLGEHAPE